MIRTPVRMRGMPLRRPGPVTTSSNGLNSDTMKSIADLHNLYGQLSDGLQMVKNAIATFESVKQGKQGVPGTPGKHGKDGRDGQVPSLEILQEMLRSILKTIPSAKDEKPFDEDRMIDVLLSSQKFRKLMKNIGSKKEENVQDPESLMRMVMSEFEKRLPDVGAIEAKIAEVRNHVATKNNWRGGGDTVVAGTGVTITNTVNGNKKITATATGLSIITVSGTINDSNMTFTAAVLPTLLNINGAFYKQTGGAITWTYAVGTITLSSPIGTGGSIFGV